jgi:hypothetical protein
MRSIEKDIAKDAIPRSMFLKHTPFDRLVLERDSGAALGGVLAQSLGRETKNF